MIRELLERGYRVRGTVRSLSTPGKYDFLTSLVQFRPARESVVAAVEDLVRWGHLAKT